MTLESPIEFFLGRWESQGFTGENRAPDEQRAVENTKFKQVTVFELMPQTSNHEQNLSLVRFKTQAWEEGDGSSDPFHEEVGYYIWDEERRQLMKCFAVPRGIAVNAGGTVAPGAKVFDLKAEVGSATYGICSNPFLDQEFKSIRYDLKITVVDNKTFQYEEDTQIKISGQNEIFHHTEKNTMKRV